MRVAVVILNWNARQLLETYLPSVLANLPDYAELIVADNDSTDDSLAYLREHHPNIRIIRNPENGGFAQGYNQALQQVEAEYYVLLNSDVEVTEQWIEPMVTYLDAHPEVVACQPKVRSHAIPDEFEYSGAAGGYIDHLGYPFCRGRLLNSMEKDSGQYDDAVEVFWATGACLFIRSEAFHALGGFDADFFAHMEEIDLCWRMKNRGKKIGCCGQSHVYHVGGGTLN
ncbi:MAG: glycosyltransferase family 2 protein, partial [Bacteroidota bacterium]